MKKPGAIFFAPGFFLTSGAWLRDCGPVRQMPYRALYFFFR